MEQERFPYWQRLVALFFGGWVMLYVNRTILPPLMQTLRELWNLNQTQLGLINSLFFLMYTVLQIPAGILADRYGRKHVLVPGYLIHGIGAALGGFAGGFTSFMGARVLTGLFQGSYYAPHYSLATAEIPPHRRAGANAVMGSGAGFGIIIGSTLASLLVFRWGWSWRSVFILAGLFTVLLAMTMQLVVRDDRKSHQAVASTNSVPTPSSHSIPKELWTIFIIGFCAMYGLFLILTWLPSYLTLARGFDRETAGLLANIMPLATIPSAIFFGVVADRTGRRKLLLNLLLPVAALGLFLVMAAPSRPVLYLGLALYGLSGKLVIDPMMSALVASVTPAGAYGKVFGTFNFCGTVAMVLAPTLTGSLVDITGSFNSAFIVAIAFQMTAWLLSLRVKEASPEPVSAR
ncbi:MAG: MFS transporter [Bacillota bacterium]